MRVLPNFPRYMYRTLSSGRQELRTTPRKETSLHVSRNESRKRYCLQFGVRSDRSRTEKFTVPNRIRGCAKEQDPEAGPRGLAALPLLATLSALGQASALVADTSTTNFKASCPLHIHLSFSSQCLASTAFV
jgi:hypothetical protein